MLRQMGLAAKARELAERALAYHRLGWSMQSGEPPGSRSGCAKHP